MSTSKPSYTDNSQYHNYQMGGGTPSNYRKYSLGGNWNDVTTTGFQDYRGSVEETGCGNKAVGFLKGFAKGASGWSMLRATYYSVSGREGEAFQTNSTGKAVGSIIPLSIVGAILGGLGGILVRSYDHLRGQRPSNQRGDVSNDQVRFNQGDGIHELNSQQNQNINQRYQDVDEFAYESDDDQQVGFQPHQQGGQNDQSGLVDDPHDPEKLCQELVKYQTELAEAEQLCQHLQQLSEQGQGNPRQLNIAKQNVTRLRGHCEMMHRLINPNEPNPYRAKPGHVQIGNNSFVPDKMTMAPINQYNAGGVAACSTVVSHILRDAMEQNDMYAMADRLHDSNYLGKVVTEGSEEYKEKRGQSAQYAPVVQDLLNLKQIDLFSDATYHGDPKDPNYPGVQDREWWFKQIDYPDLSAGDQVRTKLTRDFEEFGKVAQAGYIINGTETLAVVSDGRGHFDLFDPHGKTQFNDKNTAEAFTVRLNAEQLVAFLLTYNPMMISADIFGAEDNDGGLAFEVQRNQLGDDGKQHNALQQGWIEVDWLQQGKHPEDQKWLNNEFGYNPYENLHDRENDAPEVMNQGQW